MYTCGGAEIRNAAESFDVLYSYSEASEDITLWCSGNGPWYEVRFQLLPSFSFAFLHCLVLLHPLTAPLHPTQHSPPLLPRSPFEHTPTHSPPISSPHCSTLSPHCSTLCSNARTNSHPQFPIMPNGEIYTSSSSDYQSPGTDRVIFTESGTYCA